MSNRRNVVALWVVFLFGMVFHSLLAVMPVFWGQSIAMSQEQIAANPIDSSMWMMLLFFLLPMVVITVTVFIETKWYRVTNFVFTVLLTLMNVFHLVEHLGENPVDSRQIVLLTFVFIAGILLNFVSYRWMKE